MTHFGRKFHDPSKPGSFWATPILEKKVFPPLGRKAIRKMYASTLQMSHPYEMTSKLFNRRKAIRGVGKGIKTLPMLATCSELSRARLPNCTDVILRKIHETRQGECKCNISESANFRNNSRANGVSYVSHFLLGCHHRVVEHSPTKDSGSLKSDLGCILR